MVECVSHGSSFQTFVCEELAASPRQEWFSGPPDDAAACLTPGARGCDKIYRAYSAWTDENCSRIELKVLRHHCYEAARGRATGGHYRLSDDE